MKASEARDISLQSQKEFDAKMDKRQKEFLKSQRTEFENRKDISWDRHVRAINSIVKRIASNNSVGTYNRAFNLDDVYHLPKEDWILYTGMVKYFENEGFTVVQYADCGFYLKW